LIVVYVANGDARARKRVRTHVGTREPTGTGAETGSIVTIRAIREDGIELAILVHVHEGNTGAGKRVRTHVLVGSEPAGADSEADAIVALRSVYEDCVQMAVVVEIAERQPRRRKHASVQTAAHEGRISLAESNATLLHVARDGCSQILIVGW
jgi:hypothetical protein